MPDVTIVVGCYMQEKYVEAAYWSAMNQDFEGEIEVVLHHDNCNIGKGTGAAAARNYAIRNLVSTPWVICLDADDLLPRNYVRSLWRCRPDWIDPTEVSWFAGCPVQFISGRNLERFGNTQQGHYNIEDFRYCVPPVPVSAMFSYEAFLKVSGFNADLVTMEDFDFWYKLLEAGYDYHHTLDTCLLKTNDGFGKVHRTPIEVRQATIDYMNKRYDLHLKLPKLIK